MVGVWSGGWRAGRKRHDVRIWHPNQEIRRKSGRWMGQALASSMMGCVAASTSRPRGVTLAGFGLSRPKNFWSFIRDGERTRDGLTIEQRRVKYEKNLVDCKPTCNSNSISQRLCRTAHDTKPRDSPKITPAAASSAAAVYSKLPTHAYSTSSAPSRSYGPQLASTTTAVSPGMCLLSLRKYASCHTLRSAFRVTKMTSAGRTA